jgi:hypothetical protein
MRNLDQHVYIFYNSSVDVWYHIRSPCKTYNFLPIKQTNILHLKRKIYTKNEKKIGNIFHGL